MKAILDRIARHLGADTVDRLLELPPRDLTSLLLHLFAERARRLAARDLLDAHARTPACAVSFADPRKSLLVQAALVEAAAAFEALELSPVGPLGAAQVLGGVHQNNVLSATRGLEVLGDASLALVLECARRRRAGHDGPLRLCASQRVMRMQPAPPGLLPHFRLWAQVTAARAPIDAAAELRDHVAVYLRALRALEGRGFRFGDVTVDLSHTGVVERRLAAAGVDRQAVRRAVRTHLGGANRDFGLPPLVGLGPDVLAAAGREGERLASAVVAPLAAAHPEVTFRLDLGRLEGLGYYDGPCVRVTARDVDGQTLPLVDGGFLDWTRRLLDDGRERLLATGVGVDLICFRYAPSVS
jgi:hypothetical protein